MKWRYLQGAALAFCYAHTRHAHTYTYIYIYICIFDDICLSYTVVDLYSGGGEACVRLRGSSVQGLLLLRCAAHMWDVRQTAKAAHAVNGLRLEGAVIIAVGEAMSMLGEKSWYCSTVDSSVIPFKGASDVAQRTVGGALHPFFQMFCFRALQAFSCSGKTDDFAGFPLALSYSVGPTG